jgi:hypothetical protein
VQVWPVPLHATLWCCAPLANSMDLPACGWALLWRSQKLRHGFQRRSDHGRCQGRPSWQELPLCRIALGRTRRGRDLPGRRNALTRRCWAPALRLPGARRCFAWSRRMRQLHFSTISAVPASWCGVSNNIRRGCASGCRRMSRSGGALTPRWPSSSDSLHRACTTVASKSPASVAASPATPSRRPACQARHR